MCRTAPGEWWDREMAEAAASSAMTAELSSAGWRKPVGEQYLALPLLERFAARGVPFTTASDAHRREDVADGARGPSWVAGHRSVSIPCRDSTAGCPTRVPVGKSPRRLRRRKAVGRCLLRPSWPQSYTELKPEELGHLQRLLGSWSVLADLSFSDLLLVVPVTAA